MTLLRTLAVVVTVLLGIGGILWPVKDEGGKITRKGQLTLALIVLSGFLAIVLEAIQARKEEAEERESRERSDLILQQVNRSLNRIEDLEVTLWVFVPLQQPQLKDYAERLNKRFAYIAADPNSTEIPATPMVRPIQYVEEIADTSLSRLCVHLNFFKDGRLYWQPGTLVSDLEYQLVTSVDHPRAGMQGDFKKQRILIAINDFRMEKPIRSNGTIISLPDLPGSTLFVWFCTSSVIHPRDKVVTEQDIKRILDGATFVLQSFQPKILGLKLRDGRILWLPMQQFERRLTKNGTPIFTYRFPNSLKEVEALYQR